MKRNGEFQNNKKKTKENKNLPKKRRNGKKCELKRKISWKREGKVISAVSIVLIMKELWLNFWVDWEGDIRAAVHTVRMTVIIKKKKHIIGVCCNAHCNNNEPVIKTIIYLGLIQMEGICRRENDFTFFGHSKEG